MGIINHLLSERDESIHGSVWQYAHGRPGYSFVRLLAILVVILFASANSKAQTCATPGKDGAGGSLTGIVNRYHPGSATVTAGSTSMTLGAATGASNQITSGDLLIVIQMQDAAISSSNNSQYGDSVNGNPGSGYTNANNAGRYEFVRATNTVGAAGGTLNFVGTGAGGGLLNTYTNANAAGAQGQRRFQVIRVPQYTTATLTSGLTAAAWNGTTGGVLALDVSVTLTLGGTVSMDGLGFRPGAGRQLSGGAGSDGDYRNLSTNNSQAQKGEGIAGTPRYLYIAATNSVLDTGVEGYPNGSSAMGAPGTAGGGGTDGNPSSNDQNSGGGGGGNGGAGGRGGNAWNSQETVGGFGGVAFAERSPSRLVMGGGGGAGTRNNTPGVTAASAGGAGGGIVIIRAGLISGTGTITANGASAFQDTLNDGGGGGGAAGSILFWVETGILTGLTVNANGGRGGDSWRTQAAGGNPGERHGPGGGGGGGVVFLSSPATSITVAAGAHGITTTSNSTFGSSDGAVGSSATNLTAGQIPGIPSGAQCSLSSSVVDLEYFEAVRSNGYVVLQWH
ncbi:MAG TPA: hypothetical protein VG778_12560, partial [Blastocatellia bacterium]|nr:hypothetical protein [Blastocatellia bacterium]